MPHQCLTPAFERHRDEIGYAQAEPGCNYKQFFLAAVIAHDHCRIDLGSGGNGANRGAPIAALGKQAASCTMRWRVACE